MGLDVTIKEVQEFRCPDCGKLVTTKDVNEVNAGGSDWRDFLKSINYYVKGGDNDWYGKDMVLTEKQARRLPSILSRRFTGRTTTSKSSWLSLC